METQPINSPTSGLTGGNQVWQTQGNNRQALQSDIHKSWQSEHLPPPFDLPGLSTLGSQSRNPFISTEELHDLLRQTFLYNIPKDEPRNGWIADAIEELKNIDEEVAEEALPEISVDTKETVERVILALPKHPIAPAIYPTMDGEIAIYFKSPDSPSSVLILVANDGQAACFSHIEGKNRRARYGDSSELPDEFVKEQLRALKKQPLFKDI